MSLSKQKRPTKALPAVVQKLKTWRAVNGDLSMAQAQAVMQQRGLQLSRRTMESWEAGARRPGRFVVEALERFLAEHPTITDAPIFSRWKETLPHDRVPEIRRLRKEGKTLASIAQQFGISTSSVSRIVRGERRVRH